MIGFRTAATRISFFAISASLAACGDSTPSAPAAPEFVVRDSAGVEIVEIERALVDALPEWRVDSVPAFDVGGSEGPTDQLLFAVVGAVRLDDGGVVVANDGSKELIWFSESGEADRRRGGEGEGPGEFRKIDALFRAGGGGGVVEVADMRSRRLTRFGPDGELVGSESLLPRGDVSISTVFGIGSGGELVASGRPVGDPEGSCGPAQEAVALTSFIGDVATHVACAAWRPAVVMVGPGIGILWVPPVHAPTSFSVSGTGVVYGAAHEREIRQLSMAGQVTRILRWTEAPTPVETPTFDSIVDAIAARAPADRRDALRTNLHQWRGPEPYVFPEFTVARSGADGSIWIRRYERGETTFNPVVPSFGAAAASAVEFLVVGPDGIPRARVSAPPGLEIFEATEAYLLGVWKDELDVERVRMYEIARGEMSEGPR